MSLHHEPTDHSYAVFPTASHEAPRITVSAGDILPLLVHAAQSNRSWLEDFREDQLEIPQDLYEVLLAYRQLNRETHFRRAA